MWRLWVLVPCPWVVSMVLWMTVSMQALHAAIDAGMNFIDTSDAYGAGHSERVVGAFLKERADRDQILICTKGGNNMVTGVRNFTPDYIRGCVEGSQRLGIAAIDLYLLHNPTLENMQARDSVDVLGNLQNARQNQTLGGLGQHPARVTMSSPAECHPSCRWNITFSTRARPTYLPERHAAGMA